MPATCRPAEPAPEGAFMPCGHALIENNYNPAQTVVDGGTDTSVTLDPKL